MGSSESKMSASAAAKPDLVIKKTHVSHLIDPRSPTVGIDRTPIQVGELESKTLAEMKSECPLAIHDPRSPTAGISRTPMREVMRATVGSFARRLGLLFYNEAEGKVIQDPCKRFDDSVEEVLGDEELASTEPLLTPRLAHNLESLTEHANLLATPDHSPPQITGDSSPFVLLDDPQVEVEIETETDINLEEAEEARESHLHKRLSMSLITCHEGATSTQIFAEVHPESTCLSLWNSEDHSYALPSITVQSESCKPSLTDEVENPQSQESSKRPEEVPSSELTKELPVSSTAEQTKVSAGICCPTLDPKSPSQLVFKPQWLGKGFGATGLRARGVQGISGKQGVSPFAVHVTVKNVTNENKGQSGKLKQKESEGRSPLQILKETNSPRGQRSQMKLKVSNQDRQRLGQMDRRVLMASLDKENR